MIFVRMALACLSLHLCGIAQEMVGKLEGKVLHTNAEPVVAANVVVTSPGLQGNRQTATDERGLFRFVVLPPGTYIVRISYVATGEAVLEGSASIWDEGLIRLEQRDIQLSEVVISTESPFLDPRATFTGANLAREEFEVLPIERNFRSIATFLPHANTSYYGDETNIAGATGSGDAPPRILCSNPFVADQRDSSPDVIKVWVGGEFLTMTGGLSTAYKSGSSIP